MVIGRFRFVDIAVAVVIIAGFAVLGAQIWLINARIDQLATKVSGIDATFGVKLEDEHQGVFVHLLLENASALYECTSALKCTR